MTPVTSSKSQEQLDRVEPTQGPIAVRPARSYLDTAIFSGLFGLLLFGPLAFGFVEPWSIFVLEAGTALLFALWVYRQTQRGELAVMWNPAFFPMLAFGSIIGVQLLFGFTAYRYQTVSSALLYTAYGLLCFLVVQCLRRTSQVKLLVTILCTYASAVALFALVQGISATTKLYWIRVPRSGGWIYGPYVNHNHYAGLMEMLFPIPLVTALSHQTRGWQKSVAAASAALIATTIFLSGSRGGMAAFAIEMTLVVAILLRGEKPGKATTAIGIFLVVVVGLLAWLGGGDLVDRMTSIRTEAHAELSGGTRLDIDRDGLKMFEKKPVLGWGLGTFPEVYPQFRTFYTNFFINAAHDDYLQLLVETGVLGFAVMIWMMVSVYRHGIRKLRGWPRDTNGALALAAMLGVTGILFHSLVDFNLQIPANAAIFYVLCVLAAMEPRFGQFQRRARKRRVEALPDLSAGSFSSLT
jgi:O-antigen ligase